MQFGTEGLSGVRKMANAHFRALGGNHYPLLEYSVITMTTTQSLPSSVAKTIEISIKAFFFFKSVGRKHPRNVIQKYMTRNSLGIQQYFHCFSQII